MLESSGVASHEHDDGFREIQLNGKQLMFAFMATMVASVVIFLCGVLVGRNVERGRAAAAVAPIGDTDIRPPLDNPVKPPTAGSTADDPTKAPPPQPADESGRTGREGTTGSLADSAPAASIAKTDGAAQTAPRPSTPQALAPAAGMAAAAAVKNGGAKAATGAAAPKLEAAAVEAPKADAVRTEAARTAVPPADDRQGWVVQVAAVKTRGEADTMASRLSAKGYTAFVLSGSGGSSVFRVRVGGYKSRRDADAVAAKLRKEERITPWVTR